MDLKVSKQFSYWQNERSENDSNSLFNVEPVNNDRMPNILPELHDAMDQPSQESHIDVGIISNGNLISNNINTLFSTFSLCAISALCSHFVVKNIFGSIEHDGLVDYIRDFRTDLVMLGGGIGGSLGGYMGRIADQNNLYPSNVLEIIKDHGLEAVNGPIRKVKSSIDNVIYNILNKNTHTVYWAMAAALIACTEGESIIDKLLDYEEFKEFLASNELREKIVGAPKQILRSEAFKALVYDFVLVLFSGFIGGWSGTKLDTTLAKIKEEHGERSAAMNDLVDKLVDSMTKDIQKINDTLSNILSCSTEYFLEGKFTLKDIDWNRLDDYSNQFEWSQCASYDSSIDPKEILLSCLILARMTSCLKSKEGTVLTVAELEKCEETFNKNTAIFKNSDIRGPEGSGDSNRFNHFIGKECFEFVPLASCFMKNLVQTDEIGDNEVAVLGFLLENSDNLVASQYGHSTQCEELILYPY